MYCWVDNQISKSHSLLTIIDIVLSFFFLRDDIVTFSNKASPSQPFEVKINEWNTCFFILWFMILWFLLRIHLVFSALCIHLAFQDILHRRHFLFLQHLFVTFRHYLDHISSHDDGAPADLLQTLPFSRFQWML